MAESTKKKIEELWLRYFGWLPIDPNDPCKQFFDEIVKIIEFTEVH